MATDDSEQDRSEKATPFKLREARKQGQVAKSVELTGTALMLSAAAFVYLFGGQLIDNALQLSAAIFSQAGNIHLSGHNALHLFTATSLQLLSAFWFLIALLIGGAIVVTFMQTGPVLSAQPLKPDFKRLNPVTGFKRIFGRRIVFEVSKTSLKIGLASLIIAMFLQHRFLQLLGLLATDIHMQPARLLHEVLSLAFWLLGLLAAIALLDFIYVKWDFNRNMRMSRREIREEVKKREGDPKIKARIRELQREAVSRSASLSRVPDADALITNPTHLSVAVQYRQGQMMAPIVIAKGAGELALKMRIKAAQHRVPLIESKALARKLFERVNIDEPIIPETYAQVARILTAVYNRRAAAGTAGRAP
jgi:flagellar biosynthetic protein FlhB